MNQPESTRTFTPKQALAPTPQLYDELVGDCMEKLAQATLDKIPPLTNGALIHDNGCGTGAASAVIASVIQDCSEVAIKGTDINGQALEVYRKQATKHNWPAEAIQMDSTALTFPDETFTHSIGNAFLMVLPEDGIGAVKEMYRTLKTGGVAVVNSWAYIPNIPPIHAAALATRPPGTPVPRQAMDKWASEDHLRGVLQKGGFEREKITVVQSDVYVSSTSEMSHYATMLWSFIGGTSAAGWLESDEENWDKAIDIVKDELKKMDGYKGIEGGRVQLKFVAHIAVATK